MIDEEDCVQALREAADELGRSPTKAEYEALDITPAASSIRRVVGSWNRAKEIAGLEQYDQGENGGFPVQPKPSDVTIPADKEWEDLSASSRWYYKNREHRIAVKERRRREVRRWFYELKRDRYFCQRCGEGAPPCLDFHHRDEKFDDVSRMVNHGYSRRRIREEIDRCRVLCANCHQRTHSPYRRQESQQNVSAEPENFGRDRKTGSGQLAREPESKREKRAQLRRWVYAYKAASDGCKACGESDPACLEFHHVDDDAKVESIGQLVSFTTSTSRLLDEIEKCEILCRNCHRKLHYQIPAKPD